MCRDMHDTLHRCKYLLVWFHDDGLLILLRHQHAGGERGLQHVDDQVVGQDVQFLHLVPCHVGASSDAISSKRGRRTIVNRVINLRKSIHSDAILKHRDIK